MADDDINRQKVSQGFSGPPPTSSTMFFGGAGVSRQQSTPSGSVPASHSASQPGPGNASYLAMMSSHNAQRATPVDGAINSPLPSPQPPMYASNSRKFVPAPASPRNQLMVPHHMQVSQPQFSQQQMMMMQQHQQQMRHMHATQQHQQPLWFPSGASAGVPPPSTASHMMFGAGKGDIRTSLPPNRTVSPPMMSPNGPTLGMGMAGQRMMTHSMMAPQLHQQHHVNAMAASRSPQAFQRPTQGPMGAVAVGGGGASASDATAGRGGGTLNVSSAATEGGASGVVAAATAAVATTTATTTTAAASVGVSASPNNRGNNVNVPPTTTNNNSNNINLRRGMSGDSGSPAGVLKQQQQQQQQQQPPHPPAPIAKSLQSIPRLKTLPLPSGLTPSLELQHLYQYLLAQDREQFQAGSTGSPQGALAQELFELSAAELTARVGDFRNLHFRLACDEVREMQRGRQMSILPSVGSSGTPSRSSAAGGSQ